MTHNPWLNQVKHSGALVVLRNGEEGREVLAVRPRLTYEFRDFINGWYATDQIRDHLLSRITVNEAMILLTKNYRFAYHMFAGKPPPERMSERMKKTQRKFDLALGSEHVQKLLRKPSFTQPNLIIPRGRLKQGESALDASIRETQEETGISTDRLRWHPACVAVDSYFTYNGHYRISYNCATLADNDNHELSCGYEQMVEIGEVCWLPLTRLRELDPRQQNIVKRFQKWLRSRKLL